MNSILFKGLIHPSPLPQNPPGNSIHLLMASISRGWCRWRVSSYHRKLDSSNEHNHLNKRVDTVTGGTLVFLCVVRTIRNLIVCPRMSRLDEQRMTERAQRKSVFT
ncbi:hypothetical protein CDAR_20461 [Caerostris darwini]|uniref:Uncharacterized protein n=1 Tax=Caerostris darwini TaxID=1538125 RepID=A0AAV4QER3_9ARAC|nr:hypothetical protein CDAR_20461 [Caerostris darwini]